MTRSTTGGRCDERIGRFCLTHDDGVDWPIPPEPREVRAARGELIADLEAARTRLPGDEWINGQLIRYLLEARRHTAAIEAAGDCRATGWWCAALLGLAYHDAGRPGEAEAAFDAALGEMDDAERARWQDLTLVLPGALRGAYRSLSTSDQRMLEERYWALADPFFTRSGNELRSEHLARNLRARILGDSATPDGTTWRPDQQEVLLRYGWPLGWERSEPAPGQIGEASLIAQLGTSPFLLLPPADAVLGRAPTGDWDRRDAAPRAEYEIALLDSIATWIYPLEHQFAVFYRDDRTPVLVGTYALSAEDASDNVKVVSGIGFVPFDRPHLAGGSAILESAGRRGGHTAKLPIDTAVVVSLELVLPETRHIARARRFLPAHPVLAGPHLSDLLIIDPGPILPNSLDDAATAARGSSKVRAGDEIGIFWELYHPREVVHLTLLFASARPAGILRRIAEGIGIAERSVPIRLEWDETAGGENRLARAVTIRIPPATSGEYTLELTAEPGDGTRVTSSRILQVERR